MENVSDDNDEVEEVPDSLVAEIAETAPAPSPTTPELDVTLCEDDLEKASAEDDRNENLNMDDVDSNENPGPSWQPVDLDDVADLFTSMPPTEAEDVPEPENVNYEYIWTSYRRRIWNSSRATLNLNGTI